VCPSIEKLSSEDSKVEILFSPSPLHFARETRENRLDLGLVDKMLAMGGGQGRGIAKILSAIPGDVVAFLASQRASYVNGSI
jgi:hypothetical protein